MNGVFPVRTCLGCSEDIPLRKIHIISFKEPKVSWFRKRGRFYLCGGCFTNIIRKCNPNKKFYTWQFGDEKNSGVVF